MNHEHRHEPDGGNGMKSKTKWVFIGFVLIAAYFLITEHKAHVTTWLAQYWIFLLLLACPLLHVFMHGGHGGHGGDDRNAEGRDEGKRKAAGREAGKRDPKSGHSGCH